MTKFNLTMYRMDELEWCSGRMAHLRVKGESQTICGADPNSYITAGIRRRTLTEAEAARKHQCKSCLKRVKP